MPAKKMLKKTAAPRRSAPSSTPAGDIGASIGRLIAGTVSKFVGGSGAYYPRPSYVPRGTGKGAYTIRAPVSKAKGRGSYEVTETSERLAPQTPSFQSRGDEDGVVISHREYLGDIISSSTAGAFKIDSFTINPGNINAFPWLSQLVGGTFQQYKFESLIFHFKSTSADSLNSTNTALGSVFACVNYDSSDPAFQSRYEVENSDWSKSCKPSEHMLIPVECAARFTALNGMLYTTLNGINPTGTDPKMYDLGRMYIASQGLQGTSVNMGSLYVTYRIRLYKPIMSRPLAQALIFSQVRSGTIAGSVRFGTTNVVAAQNCDTIGCLFTDGNTLTISSTRLVVGMKFICTIILYRDGTATTYVAPTITLSSGLAAENLWSLVDSAQYNYSVVTSPSASAAGQAHCGVTMSFTVLNNDVNQTLTISGGPVNAVNGCQVSLYQINGLPLSRIGSIYG